jgi:hypothetical protein
LHQTYEIAMRLTPEQYAAIRDEFRGTTQWSAFKGYYDWRTSGHAANAASAIDRFRDVLAEIVLRRSGTGTPSLDDIIDALYEDESERLNSGMLPVPVCPTDNDESAAYFTAKLGNTPRLNEHIAALVDRLERSAAPGMKSGATAADRLALSPGTKVLPLSVVAKSSPMRSWCADRAKV